MRREMEAEERRIRAEKAAAIEEEQRMDRALLQEKIAVRRCRCPQVRCGVH